MKKSTILSLATAGAIVATSAFTFAAWDQTEATGTASLTFRKPVTITEEITNPIKADYTLNAEATIDVPVTFAINNDDSLATSLEIVPTLKTSSGNDISGKVDFVIKDSESQLVTDGKVSNPSTSSKEKYTITVTNKADSGATYDELNGANLTVVATLK
ncbi:hypothetical protein [Candidatus Stoquefichus sp. SB1]|uniref:hypothetical protein n=1 Tax=Candidatus Stoquefichus sp. SB1 TaxID=1658109 RepID=UPI00067F0F0A|nr:hypothetical protein [Candidatus Stoquefichus sp. SB1]